MIPFPAIDPAVLNQMVLNLIEDKCIHALTEATHFGAYLVMLRECWAREEARAKKQIDDNFQRLKTAARNTAHDEIKSYRT